MLVMGTGSKGPSQYLAIQILTIPSVTARADAGSTIKALSDRGPGVWGGTAILT